MAALEPVWPSDEDVLALLPEGGAPASAPQPPNAAVAPQPARDPLRLDSGLLHTLPSDLARQLCEATAATDAVTEPPPQEQPPAALALEQAPPPAIGDVDAPAAPAAVGVADPGMAPELQPEATDPELKATIARLLTIKAAETAAQLPGEPAIAAGDPTGDGLLLLDRLLSAPGSAPGSSRGGAGSPLASAAARPQRPGSAPSARLASPARTGSWSPHSGARRDIWSAGGDGGLGGDPLGAGGNAGPHIYARQSTWQKRNQQRYEEQRLEEERRELRDCTFSPRICPRSRQLSGRAANGRPASAQLAAMDGSPAALRQQQQQQLEGSNAGELIYHRQTTQRQRAQQRAEDARREREQAELAACTFSPKIDHRSRRMLSAGVERYPMPRDFTAIVAALPAAGSAALAGLAPAAGRGSAAQIDDAWIEIAPGSSLEEIAAMCMETAMAAAPQPAGAAAAPLQLAAASGDASSSRDAEGSSATPVGGQQGRASEASSAAGWEPLEHIFPGMQQPSPVKTGQPRPSSAEVQLAASRRLYAHAMGMQQRQKAAKEALAQQELAEAQSASPRIKALPAFYRHTASSAARAKDGASASDGGGSLGGAPAGRWGRSPASGEEQVLFQPQTGHDALYWLQHKLSPTQDFANFLERQQSHLEQSHAKLQRQRAAPPPPRPAPAPGTVRLLAAMEQRAAAQHEAAAGAESEAGLLGGPGTAAAAAAQAQGTPALVLRPGCAGAGAVCSPCRPASYGGRPASRGGSRGRATAAGEAEAQYTYSPKISARAEAKPARSPEQLFADYKDQQRRLEARRAAAEAALMRACPFHPASATPGESPVSKRYAKVAPRVPLDDPSGAWSQRLAAREEAAAAAAAAREAQELAECTFKPELRPYRSPFSPRRELEAAGRPGSAAAAAASQAVPAGGEEEEEQADAAEAVQHYLAQVCSGQPEQHGGGGHYPASGATPAPDGAAGWSCFLDRVTHELDALQAVAAAPSPGRRA